MEAAASGEAAPLSERGKTLVLVAAILGTTVVTIDSHGGQRGAARDRR